MGALWLLGVGLAGTSCWATGNWIWSALALWLLVLGVSCVFVPACT